MVKALGKYTADAIVVTTNLDQIRRKPTGTIGTKDLPGQVHMIREIIDNSVDELVLHPDGGDIKMLLLRDSVNNRYQMIISDTGRGIPYGKLRDATTILGASGKGDSEKSKNVYTSSGGQFGYGLKVSAALSTRFRILSSNNTERKIGTVYLENGKVVDHYSEICDNDYGVIVVFEPDFSLNEDGQGRFFNNGPEFMNSGYMEIIKICKQLNIFNEKLRFEFSIIDRPLPKDLWRCDLSDGWRKIQLLINDPSREVIYDSRAIVDKSSYLFNIWRCSSPVIFSDAYGKNPVDINDRLGYDIKMYFSTKSTTGNPQYFVTVNNVSLLDTTQNSATLGFMKVLRHQLAERMIGNDILAKFIREEYRFPTMMLAIGIRYHLADHSGITKSSFTDSIFERDFMNSLTHIAGIKGVEYWDNLLQILTPDIETRFAQIHNTPMKTSDSKKTYIDLERPEHYSESKRTGPDCELYIVEGTSAGNIIGTRDPNTQAIYRTRGKPTNAATSVTQKHTNIKTLLKDPIYRDIMRILNVTPSTTDIKTACRYGKVIISVDADADGHHIAAIHIHNLILLNEELINCQFVYVALPPLYSIDTGNGKKIFIRDEVALQDAKIEFLYRPTLSVRVMSSSMNYIHDKPLTDTEFRDMAFLITYVGDAMAIMASQLNIPLLVLERLVLAVEHLYPKVNYEGLAEHFTFYNSGNDNVQIQVNEIGRFIVVSVGRRDYTIGLDTIGDAIFNNLLPFINKYKLKECHYLVKSKMKGAELSEETPMSMMMLYIAMCNLNKLFKISRYKGLGEMDQKDCFETIMNPATRSIIAVTSVGDFRKNYELLGSDSTARKRLLTDAGSVTNKFMKTMM